MGIKKNFVFSTVLTVANYIFPFIVYPYVARVLGPNNIGIVNFVDSMVNYATMISMMGIAIIGVRDIAKAKGNKQELDTTFTSLFVLCATFTVLASVVLVIATYNIAELSDYKPMLMIGLLKLWSNFLLIDWLYRGLEDFKYITVRTILVKLGYMIAVFVLIHQASDYVIYYILMCLMVTFNAAFNCYRATKLVSFRLDRHQIRQLFKPFFILGIYLFLNSMYTTFNVLYLGLKCGDTSVGYYTTATKTFQLILAVYTAYSGVVMPRASALLSENRHDEFKVLIGKSMQALLMFSIPAVCFTMIFSPGIIDVIAGSQFGGAILPMTIVMPLIFIIGYEQILVVQILTPLATDKVILLLSSIGATVGITLNLTLVGDMGAEGSAVVWLLAEISVLIAAQIFVTRYTSIRFPLKSLVINILAYLPYVLIAFAMSMYLPYGNIVKMAIGGIFCGTYFIVVQLVVLRNQIFIEMYDKTKNRLVNHRIK